ncbi:MAG: tRNA 2-selenouridine(34) synthase MnmH [Bacillota bacterium]|nr:tRNA 2-selenouridine(34) synthase MnmH [Bacillota bacterium]MDW7676044.1 tRNA 2-selenouridine(34) synthase MnmH [Bacillota bacterium]
MNTITVEELMQLDNRILIDLRSPGEYQQGTIDDAVNLPILDDEERAIVGTVYKQENREKAKITGIRHVSAKLDHLVEEVTRRVNTGKRVILFCSRGGYRSGPFTELLNSLGIEVSQLVGGYKSYRRFIMEYFDQQLPKIHRFIVLHGNTGCGKTAILKKLAAFDIPVIDLESLARNSGSVFGFIGHPSEKMTQKQFESLLVHQLMEYRSKPIFVESESIRIGRVNIPKPMHQQMESGRHILINASMAQRVDQLVNDYCDTFTQMQEPLLKAMNDLVKFLGHDHVNRLKVKLKEGRYHDIALDLMTHYYDPLYRHSIQKYTYDLQITYDTMNEALDTLSGFYHQETGAAAAGKR